MDANVQIGLVILAVALQTIFIFLRFYALKIHARKLRKVTGILSPARSWVTELLQDILTTLVWIISIAFSVYQTLEIKKNETTQFEDRVKAETTEDILKTQRGFAQAAFMSNFLYVIALWSIKASFLVYYTTISQWSTKSLRIYIYIVDAIAIITFLIMSGLLLFWCKSPSDIWLTESQQCYITYQANIPLALFLLHLLTDLLILSLAVLILRSIIALVPRRERNAILFMIVLASSTMSMAILRFAMAKVVDPDYKVTPVPDSKYMYIVFTNTEEDASRHRLNLDTVASGFEVTMGLIAACLPALKVLVRGYLARGASEEGGAETTKAGSTGGSASFASSGWNDVDSRRWEPQNGSNGSFGRSREDMCESRDGSVAEFRRQPESPFIPMGIIGQAL